MKPILLIPAVLAAAFLPALAGEPPDPAAIRGEVVATRSTPAAAGESRCLEIQVQQGNRERAWLRLGPVDEMTARFRNGDRVRARVMTGQEGDVALVREIRNETTGTQMRLRDARGEMLRLRDRDRLRDGSGDRERMQRRDRDRVHEPGTGGGRGSGTRRGGR